jgi:hypothetical protein
MIDYKKYLQVAQKITGGDQRAQDLLHDVLLQLSNNQVFIDLPKKDKLYYITKALKNQFYSNNSNFSRRYRKYEFTELSLDIDEIDVEYDEQPTIDWVKQTLEEELVRDKDFWYNKGLFDIWLNNKGFIERVHKQTHIPRYSIKDTINQVKELLNQRWIQYKNK